MVSMGRPNHPSKAMKPVLPTLPFPSALLLGGQPIAGTPWLMELLADASARWFSASGEELLREELPWHRDQPWQGALTLHVAAEVRHFQLAGLACGEEAHWLWQFLEEEPASARARAVVRAVGALPDSLTVSTSELISAASEWTAVVDALPQMLVLTGIDGRITRCNEAFRRFAALPFSRVVGRSLAQVVCGGEATSLSAEYYASTASAVHCPGAGWFLVRGFPIQRNSQLRGWVHAFEDLSAAGLLGTGHRPLIACEQASDGIALVDARLRVEYANAALAALLGRPRQELMRRSLEELCLLPPTDGDEPALALALRNGQHVLRHELPRQGFPPQAIELSIAPVINPGGELAGFVLIARDVTLRERGVRQAESAAATSDLCHWLGGLRHELGNPINSVKMALTVLHSHLAEFTPEEVVRYVERALSELGRVEDLLRSLKTFTLFDPPELQDVDVDSFVERTIASMEPALARQGIALERLPAEAGPLIANADPRALHQVAMSLVTNAAEAFDGREGRIQIGAVRTNGSIELNVHDSGPGISPAQLDRLFLPFESTKRGNPGLGLTLVRRLVTAMHGSVSIESALGAGTHVRVRLDEV
jgi:PAS domain S-box-containing protein